LRFQFRFDPGKEFLNDRSGVIESVLLFFLSLELVFPNPGFNGIERAEGVQYLSGQRRFGGLGFEEFAPTVCPALRMGDSCFLRIGFIGSLPQLRHHF
jgi:hypothetical protein